jgi:carboxyl-terminal processing protease
VYVSREIPIVVLVDRYTASASEIVSACLQDHGRAVICGERTWGKGTVQNVYELEGGRSAIRLTTATYLRPSEKNIHKRKGATEEDEWGVQPDEGMQVVLTDEEREKVVLARRQRDFATLRTPAATNGQRKEDANPPDDSLPPEKEPPMPQVQEDPTAKPAEETSIEPFDDPQMRKAIDYLQERLDATRQPKAA